ncbi:hypothetical protein GH714_021745 [Hevea brasiliensis]|uniref:Uncharacterized protein n=1 Tax=Hevea brasiliensis TaxID=3981 RepID=A0A6A6MJY7_HEVBR|nr:hypothetical protein GH714_021745 [Hevea brasiliensis]
MGSWSLESSMEGLQSKLERWRTELPPVYDRSDLSSCNGSVVAGGRGAYRHKRRSSDSDGVSCFGTVCGVECSIVCGGSPPRKQSGRVKRSPSAGGDGHTAHVKNVKSGMELWGGAVA